MNWNEMGSDQKSTFVGDNLEKAFENAMKPANIGKDTPKDYFIEKLKEVGITDYTDWYYANADWIPGRITNAENDYGFDFEDMYVEPDEIEAPPVIEPPANTPQQSEGFITKLKNNPTAALITFIVVIILIVVAIKFFKS